MHVLKIAGHKIITTPNFTTDAIRVYCEKLGIDTIIAIAEYSDEKARELVQVALKSK